MLLVPSCVVVVVANAVAGVHHVENDLVENDLVDVVVAVVSSSKE